MAERRAITTPLAEHVNTDAMVCGQGMVLKEQSTSLATPSSGYAFMYCKTDGHLYFKNDAGTETQLT